MNLTAEAGRAIAHPRDPSLLHNQGALCFAHYAYAPNERGFCGSDDHRALLEYGAAGVVDDGLAGLARAFNGAWPYLQLIAEETGIGDPLDARVVEAYWLGSPLLERLDRGRFGRSLEDRFRHRAALGWQSLAEVISGGGLPSHAFHVLAVYPWVGLLGRERGETPLHILDRCRIRWGRVEAVQGDAVLVRNQTLEWTGHRLILGPPIMERVRRAIDGRGFANEIVEGDWVSLHWDWVCERLSAAKLTNLRRYHAYQLGVTNRRLAHPGPAMVLG